MKNILCAILVSSTFLVAGNLIDTKFDSNEFSKVAIENDSGNITVQFNNTDSENKTSISAEGNTKTENIPVQIVDGVLKIAFKKSSHKKSSQGLLSFIRSIFSRDSNESVNWKVSLSKEKELDISIGSGNLSIEGVTSSIGFDIGQGNASISGSKTISGNIGNGIASVQESTGNIELSIGSGNAEFSWDKEVTRQATITCSIGLGNMTITTPDNTGVTVEKFSGSTITYEKQRTKGSDISIQGSIGWGNLIIK